MTTSTLPLALTTSLQTLASCAAGMENVVFGLVLTNTTGTARTVTLSIYTAALGTTVTVPVPVGANSRVPWDKPVGLQPGDTLSALADAVGVTAVVSQSLDTGANPVAAGFAGKGAYAAGTTYAINDVVSYSGSSYVSNVAGNIGNQPDTHATQWTLLAAQGATGATGGVPTTRLISAAGLATGGGDLSADRTITVPAAAASDVIAGTSSTKGVTPAALMGSCARGTLTDGTTIAWNVQTQGYNVTVTLAASGHTLGAPTGLSDGEPVCIEIVQGTGGNMTLNYNAIFNFRAVGLPTLSTAAGKGDLLAGIYNGRTSKIDVTGFSKDA